jgi:hypothetical protein
MKQPLGPTLGQPPVRRYPRMTAEYVLAFRRLLPGGGETAPQLTRTLSVGLGGLMFESESPLDVGEILRLEIVIGERTLKADGVVIYAERRAEELWHNGLQFTGITEDERDVLLGAYLQREYRIPPL